MYFFYLLRHKFWAMYYCFKNGLFWRGIIHDWDKLLLPSMFFTYAKYYPQISKIRKTNGYYDPLSAPQDYQRAILGHFNRSKHHWQYWVLANGVIFTPIDMPETYVREMICDWAAAGRTRQRKEWQKTQVRNFYETTKDRMAFSENTTRLIEKNLDKMGW